jgi:hypothetical protein
MTPSSLQAFKISLPFGPRPCIACEERGSGHYILINVNNAVLYHKTHHRGGGSSPAHIVKRNYPLNTLYSAISLMPGSYPTTRIECPL